MDLSLYNWVKTLKIFFIPDCTIAKMIFIIDYSIQTAFLSQDSMKIVYIHHVAVYELITKRGKVYFGAIAFDVS